MGGIGVCGIGAVRGSTRMCLEYPRGCEVKGCIGDAEGVEGVWRVYGGYTEWCGFLAAGCCFCCCGAGVLVLQMSGSLRSVERTQL